MMNSGPLLFWSAAALAAVFTVSKIARQPDEQNEIG
jgi:hypothetical protein